MKNIILALLLFGSIYAKKPDGKILFQPLLVWKKGEATTQGTGFLIKHNEKFYGITSMHFLKLDGTGLSQAIWLDIPGNDTISIFTKSYGIPKFNGLNTYDDLVNDYLILPSDENINSHTAVEIDVRENITKEKVLFPNKSWDSETGYEWVEGIVKNDNGNYIDIQLNKAIVLQSQSGSPVFSAKTLKVIGMVSTGNTTDGRTELSLCPTREIVKTINKQKDIVDLKKAIK